MSFEQILGHLPRLIIVVGIMYFMFNPLFKQQNTIHPATLAFVIGVLVTIWVNVRVMDVRQVLIICGVLAAVALAAWAAMRFLGWNPLLLLNLTPSDGALVSTFLLENALAIGLSEAEVRFDPRFPWFVVFRTKQHALSAKLARETEIFIRKHVPRKFFAVWAPIIVGLILIASLWRF